MHNDVRLDILFDDAQSLAATINQSLIRLMVDLNYGEVAAYPVYRLRVEEPEDQRALVEIVEKGVAMGQPVSTAWFSKKFGIPLPEEGEAVLGNRAAIPDGSEGDGGSTPHRAAHATHAHAHAPDAAEIATATLAREAQPHIDQWLAQITLMLDEADSLEHFRAMLGAAWPKLSSEGLAEAVTTALAAMDLAGRYDVARGA
ncbi:hypothetical protein AGMMS49545_19910 [Betaproteobacteria bacterium]|nr:hypothetical protein AGMMS49545_19910 [Betaproteobacteria bacterium]GHU48632.1 hypothetical protein AGMMS50289_25450 [Betaproteobacteria bacterium]